MKIHYYIVPASHRSAQKIRYDISMKILRRQRAQDHRDLLANLDGMKIETVDFPLTKAGILKAFRFRLHEAGLEDG